MSKVINYPLFEEIMEQFNGQTAIMTFNGSMAEFRMFHNFEFCLHIDSTGYFLGSTDDEDLDIQIDKESIIDYEYIEPDELFSSNSKIIIKLINDDILRLTFFTEDFQNKTCKTCNYTSTQLCIETCRVNLCAGYGSKYDNEEVTISFCSPYFDLIFGNIFKQECMQ